jgi:hypothetical protein
MILLFSFPFLSFAISAPPFPFFLITPLFFLYHERAFTRVVGTPLWSEMTLLIYSGKTRDYQISPKGILRNRGHSGSGLWICIRRPCFRSSFFLFPPCLFSLVGIELASDSRGLLSRLYYCFTTSNQASHHRLPRGLMYVNVLQGMLVVKRHPLVRIKHHYSILPKFVLFLVVPFYGRR